MRIGKELDAAVLAVLGWVYEPERLGELVSLKAAWWSPDRREVIYVDDELRCELSTSDPEAVRLCLPWLRERNLYVHLDDAWNPRTKSRVCVSSACVRDESCDLGTEWKTMAYEEGATFAECICRLVLAISEREAARKEPTT